jgi:prepilin-type processing-associated H-X9-DG protein
VAISVRAANDVFVGTFFCPSSPLEKWCFSPPPGTPRRIMAANYVAISGGANSLFPTGGYNDRVRWAQGNPGTADCCSGGIHASNGAMVASGTHGIEALSDGTSNVYMISESSNWIFTQTNQKKDWRASHTHGWIIGWWYHDKVGQHVDGYGWPNLPNDYDHRTFNFTTIRYPINHFSMPSHGLPDHPGNCGTLGVCYNSSTNRPLNSAHPGGVNVAMADGSVRFVSQTIPNEMLGRFAVRDDRGTTDGN